MIGHYINNLTPPQEDRVLTMRLHGGCYMQDDGCRCLRGAAEDVTERDVFADASKNLVRWSRDKLDFTYPPFVGLRYDDLYGRFGERLNTAIRNRILSNRARRTLSQARPVFTGALA